jgi:L-threonylcarbamoyladenylate synthase
MVDAQPINPNQPEIDIINAAGALIRSGGVVIFPSSGLYGVGADIFNAAAVERVFRIKGRPRNKPLLALISRRKMLSCLTGSIPPLAEFFMDRFWPGGVTLVMTGQDHLPAGLLSSSGKIGVRLVGHPVAAALVDAAEGPITGTSANLSGASGCADPKHLAPALKAAVDCVLDAGPLIGGVGSTVVDICGSEPKILRQGAVKSKAVMSAFYQYQRQHVDNAG